MQENTQARRWVLTINNPKETDEEMQDYIKNLEHFKYSMFQREKGEEKGTIHFQIYIVFTIGKRFSTIKTYFPTAHIEKANGSNVQCRDYCSKSDTRISGPYELGTFTEKGERTDLRDFYELIDNGATDIQLRELFPSLYLKEFNKIDKLRTMKKSDIYKKQERDIETIYIYGPSGSGKTTYVRDLIREENYFYVDTFDNSAFTGYAGEDILVIDEFKGNGQFTIQFMNRLLDFAPVKLRGLNYIGQACFTKVYIISNFHYKELYKQEQEENISQYNGFVRRLSKVIQINSPTDIFVERETIFEDMPKDEIKPFGKTKRISQVIEYDKYGRRKIVFDRNSKQIEQTEIDLTLIEDKNLPF